MSGTASNPSIVDKADSEYMRRAHRNGYEIWPRFVETNADRAYAVFNNPDMKARIINQVVNLALQYDCDGINIDFEALGMKNKQGFVSFVRDLSEKMKENGLAVSVT
jgi:spore germination protein YaaH